MLRINYSEILLNWGQLYRSHVYIICELLLFFFYEIKKCQLYAVHDTLS